MRNHIHLTYRKDIVIIALLIVSYFVNLLVCLICKLNCIIVSKIPVGSWKECPVSGRVATVVGRTLSWGNFILGFSPPRLTHVKSFLWDEVSYHLMRVVHTVG